jgi:hypothetical protein
MSLRLAIAALIVAVGTAVVPVSAQAGHERTCIFSDMMRRIDQDMRHMTERLDRLFKWERRS